MITASGSLQSTKIKCLAFSNACTPLTNSLGLGSALPYANAWSTVTEDEFGLNPREKDGAQPSALPSPEKDSTPNELNRKLRIVIVEDNPEDIFLVEQALEYHKVKADVVCHHDGEEMLRYVEQIDSRAVPCPDVVLLDLNLPRHSGKAILARMRKSPLCGEVPVVVVSSSRDLRDQADVARLGATKYFHKSIDFDESMSLGAVILEVTRRRDTAESQ